MNIEPFLDRFAAHVAKTYEDMKVVRISGAAGRIRVMLVPTDRSRDDLLPAQRERQMSAGAVPTEAFGVDLFEVYVTTSGAELTHWNGRLVPLQAEDLLRRELVAFFDPSTLGGTRLASSAERLREGQAAAKRAASRRVS